MVFRGSGCRTQSIAICVLWHNRDSGVCFCTPDFYSQILSVGTVLSAASSGSRKESVVGSRWDRAKYSVGGVYVAHSRSCHRAQWSLLFKTLVRRRESELGDNSGSILHTEGWTLN